MTDRRYISLSALPVRLVFSGGKACQFADIPVGFFRDLLHCRSGSHEITASGTAIPLLPLDRPATGRTPALAVTLQHFQNIGMNAFPPFNTVYVIIVDGYRVPETAGFDLNGNASSSR